MRSSRFRSTFVLFALSSCLLSAFAAPTTRALEGSIEGRTVMCGVEFADNEPIFGAEVVHLFKSALRLYKIEEGSFFEFYVDASRALSAPPKSLPERVYVHAAWLRTDSGLQFRPELDMRKAGELAYRQSAGSAEHVKIVSEIVKGAPVSIGFNLTEGAYDKVFHFKPALSEHERLQLGACMTRLLK